MTARSLRWFAVAAAVVVSACAAGRPATVVGTAPPRFAEYPAPEIPADMIVPNGVRTRHANAWNHLQAGDLRTASREFTAALNQAPGLYPAEAGLAFVYLADGDFRDAQRRFAAVLAVNDRYLPALVGHADALLGLGQDADAMVAMERVLAIDPQRELMRTRLELTRFRLTQSLIDAGQRARTARQYDDAVRHLERAMTLSPRSTVILYELTRAHLAAGRFDDAERYARRAIDVEPAEASWQVALGEVLEAREDYSGAATAFTTADRMEPNPEWRARSRELTERAEWAALPPEFRRVASATQLTRGDVAAFIGIHLRDLVERTPDRAAGVATDVREHWAAPWILPVTRAGIMTIYPNHTFQPESTFSRGDLATVAAALIRLASAERGAELVKWQTARPQFADLPPANVFYPSAALAVTVRVMTADAAGRFDPTRPATGAELDAVVRRVAELAGREARP